MNSLEFLRDLTILLKQKYNASTWFKFDETYSDVLIINVETKNDLHLQNAFSLKKINMMTSSEQEQLANFIFADFETDFKKLRGE